MAEAPPPSINDCLHQLRQCLDPAAAAAIGFNELSEQLAGAITFKIDAMGDSSSAVSVPLVDKQTGAVVSTRADAHSSSRFDERECSSSRAPCLPFPLC